MHFTGVDVVIPAHDEQDLLGTCLDALEACAAATPVPVTVTVVLDSCTDRIPWDFATAWYELRRYRLLIASLPDERYRVCFEPACSVGVLTEMLAARCDEVHAVDVVDSAAAQARQRIARAGLEGVHIRTADALDPWPRPTCDLLVLSEFLYYTPAAGLDAMIGDLLRLAEPGATVAACHWLGSSDDHACHGEDVHAALARRADLTRVARNREEGFLLEVFRRV